VIKDYEHYLPKYYKISQEIIAKILKGELVPGMRIMSENEIINTYKVSNTTARKILQDIENAGWAIRVKGKGTYVRTRNVERSITRILGFSKNMIESGYVPSTKLLQAAIVPEGYHDLINGRRYRMPGPVYMIKRLRFADQIPMMLEVRYISARLCPEIIKKDLEQPLYDIYEKSYKVKLTEVNQMIGTIIIKDAETEKLFDITVPTPAFLVRGATFCGKEIILEMERSFYRGDKYTFSVRAT
jgi:GntR family transcriptional regulator